MANEIGTVLLRLGVEMEDRVLMVFPDSIEFVATWFGIAKIGAVITMVNTILPAADYEYYLEYTRAKVAIVESSAIDRFLTVARHARHLKYVMVAGAYEATGTDGVSVVPFDRMLAAASEELETAPTLRDAIAIWLLTSESTSHPE